MGHIFNSFLIEIRAREYFKWIPGVRRIKQLANQLIISLMLDPNLTFFCNFEIFWQGGGPLFQSSRCRAEFSS